MSETTIDARSPVNGGPDESATGIPDLRLREAHVAIASSDFDATGIDGLVSLLIRVVVAICRLSPGTASALTGKGLQPSV